MNKQQICPIFLKLAPEHIAHLQFTLESYEGIGILRTINPDKGEVVILAIADTVPIVKAVLENLKADFNFIECSEPESKGGDWLFETIREELGR